MKKYPDLYQLDFIKRKISNRVFRQFRYELLRPKRKPRPVYIIYTEFVTKGYLHFTEEDLFNALVKDSRFIVEKLDEGPLFAEVKVARKRKK